MDQLTVVAFELGKSVLIPSNGVVIVLAVGVLLFWSRFRQLGKMLTTISAVAIVMVAATPLVWWIAKPLEARFPPMQELPESIAGIIVLGGSFQPGLTSDLSQVQLNDHAERLTTFLALARRNKSVRLVFSGGAKAFSDSALTESDIARELLESLGLDGRRVIFEKRSRNTCENAIYTAELVNPQEEQRWVLVTSAMHMPRAVGAFAHAGFRILANPVDYTQPNNPLSEYPLSLTRNFRALDFAVHEWLGLLAYRISGCSDRLYPGP